MTSSASLVTQRGPSTAAHAAALHLLKRRSAAEGPAAAVQVEAEASTESRPREGFTPRRGAGLPLFGKSESYPAASPHTRIDFQFDRAAFSFRRLPFKIPYPVPFKLLGDETKARPAPSACLGTHPPPACSEAQCASLHAARCVC